jgi:hypothetical protein
MRKMTKNGYVNGENEGKPWGFRAVFSGKPTVEMRILQTAIV